MPELPEVETIARGLRDQFIGHRCLDLTASHKLLFQPSFAAVRRQVRDRTLITVSRQGKYLFLDFRSDDKSVTCLMLHLRMTGQVFTAVDYSPDKHVHARFDFGDRQIWWRDIRKFGRITLLTEKNKAAALKMVGPDMLEISRNLWLEKISQRRGPLKNLLLNQQIASGIGNIYADEALHRAGIHPLTPPVALTEPELKKLYRSIRSILELAIRHHGTTFSDFVDFSGKPGNFKTKLLVYGREEEECRQCGTAISRIKLTGRSAHFCPSCQPEK